MRLLKVELRRLFSRRVVWLALVAAVLVVAAALFGVHQQAVEDGILIHNPAEMLGGFETRIFTSTSETSGCSTSSGRMYSFSFFWCMEKTSKAARPQTPARTGSGVSMARAASLRISTCSSSIPRMSSRPASSGLAAA